jgi:putative two-component system response regulator
MIVDDEEMVTQAISTYLSLATEFSVVTFNCPEEAYRYFLEHKIDLVVSDFLMPKMNGLEFLTKIKAINPEVTLILLTGYADKENAIKAINELRLFQYIEKPWDNDELAIIIRNGVEKKDLVTQLQHKVKELETSNSLIEKQREELARLYELLRQDFDKEMENIENVIITLAKAIEAKDSYTENHTDRVAHLSVELGKELGCDDRMRKILYIGGLIHDIGKIGVSETVLNKPGELLSDEYEEIKKHPVIGEEICRPLHTLSNVLSIIRHHHEKLDGSGYPDGLRGDEISLAAQIVSVADIYDALTSDRPYRLRMEHEAAASILRQEVGRGKLASHIVEKFLARVQG